MRRAYAIRPSGRWPSSRPARDEHRRDSFGVNLDFVTLRLSNKTSWKPASAERNHMATKERLAAMAASLCAVCSGSMVLKRVEPDPNNGACELRTYTCAGCGHTRTYSVAAGNS